MTSDLIIFKGNKYVRLVMPEKGEVYVITAKGEDFENEMLEDGILKLDAVAVEDQAGELIAKLHPMAVGDEISESELQTVNELMADWQNFQNEKAKMLEFSKN